MISSEVLLPLSEDSMQELGSQSASTCRSTSVLRPVSEMTCQSLASGVYS